ncbi:MAG TPA: PilZ domain-containing protein [Myxococcaceae bacterium]|nr:PilZ domain-containing protein [Myxococcaceae bacterium]
MSLRIYAVDKSAGFGLARDDRRTTRAPCGATVRVQTNNGHTFGFCSDLSLGGMLFVGPALPLARVSILLHLAEVGFLFVEGEVTGHREHNGTEASIVRFPQLNPRVLRRISRFLAQRRDAAPSVRPALA